MTFWLDGQSLDLESRFTSQVDLGFNSNSVMLSTNALPGGHSLALDCCLLVQQWGTHGHGPPEVLSPSQGLSWREGAREGAWVLGDPSLVLLLEGHFWQVGSATPVSPV